MKSDWRTWTARSLLLLVCASWLAILGCATEPENASARPWNTPKTWETGLPTGLYENR